MKRIISLLLVLLLTVGSMVAPATAAADSWNAVFTASATEVQPGDIITIIGGFSNAVNISAYHVSALFDSSLVSVQDDPEQYKGENAAPEAFIFDANSENGQIVAAFSDPITLNSNCYIYTFKIADQISSAEDITIMFQVQAEINGVMESQEASVILSLQNSETPDEPENDVTYTFEDGVLTISGSGEIGWDPFGEIKSDIQTVIIEDGITAIGGWAFSACPQLTSVTIGKDVKIIDDCAFRACPVLTEIVIPTSVETIDIYAFAECPLLSSVTIGNGVKTIGHAAFIDCPALTAITIPASVETIGDWAFAGCYALKTVVLENGIKTIGEHAFLENESLTAIVIPESVTTISGYAFAECHKLASVTIGKNVNIIGECAFSACSALTEIVIPTSVETIDIYAFAECPQLTSVTIGNGVKVIGHAAFIDCPALTEITIPASVETIGDWAFARCYALKTVVLENGIQTIGEHAFLENESLTAIVIPESMKAIGHMAFYGCTSLKNVIFNDCNPSVGNHVFEACTSLRTVNLGNNFQHIGVSMFKECNNLESVILGDALVSIGDCAFLWCSALEAVYFRGNPPTVIGEAAFEGTSTDLRLCWFYGNETWNTPHWEGPDGNTYLTLPLNEHVKIPAEFPDLTRIPTVDIDAIPIIDGERDEVYYTDSVIAVIDKPGNGDVRATAEASMLTNNGLLYLYVDVKDADVVELQDTDPWITDSVELLLQTRNDTFNDTHQFRVDVLNYPCYYQRDNDIDLRGNDAEEYFVGHAVKRTNTGYTVEFCIDTKKFGVSANEYIGIQMQLNDAVTDGDWLYTHYRLTNDTFASEHFDAVVIGVDETYETTRIPQKGQCGDELYWTLSDDGVLTIYGTGDMYWDPFGKIKSEIKSVVIEDGVTSIGGYAFSECPALSSVEIGKDVTFIEDSAFRACPALKEITIPGNVTEIDIWAFAECPALETVVLENGIEIIDDCAFYDNKSLTSIVIPESVEKIGVLAFYNCSALKTVTFENCNPFIDEYAFELCSSLHTVDFGNAFEHIGVGMFYECAALTNVNFGNVVSIGKDAFNGCKALSAIILPDTLTEIGEFAFAFNESLEAVSLGNNLTTIGKYAFYDCNALFDITLPASLIEIGEYAFADNESLKTVTLGKNLTTIGDLAFFACSTLDHVVFDGCNPTMGESIFDGCGMLRYADLGNALTTLGKRMFLDCPGLETIYFRGNPPTAIGEDALTNTSPDLRLCWFVGNEDWTAQTSETSPYWVGPDGITYLTLPINEHVKIPAEFPDLTHIPTVDIDAIPIIDGERDEVYYTDSVIAVIDKPGNGEVRATAEVSMLSNNGLLYLYVDVKDADVVELQDTDPWITDSVELLLQTRNDTFNDIHQFRVDVTDYLSYYRNHNGDIQAYGDDAEKYFVGHKAVTTDDGYILEFCIDTKMFGVSANEIIGIQMQLNDVDENGNWLFTHYRLTNNTFTSEHFDAVVIGVDEEYAPLYCGEKLFYSLDKDGVLTISGTGDMSWEPFIDIKSQITSVVICDGVTSIGGYAFSECPALTSVVIGKDVTFIGNSAFRACPALKEITIPGNVTEIDIWAFAECPALETVVLENGIEIIDDCAFRDNKSLTSIVIPESVEKIGVLAFYNCSALKTVTFENCNPFIDEYAFELCSSLHTVDFGTRLEHVGLGMFYECTALKNVNFGNVVSIGKDAFTYCKALSDIKLSDTLTEIGEFAFAFNESLKTVISGQGLTTIGNYAFYDCNALSEITLSDSLVEIGEFAFAFNESLKTVTLGQNLTTIGGYAFYECKALSNITLPNSLVTIHDWAFAFNESLGTVTLGENLEWLGGCAFFCNSALESVTFVGCNPEMGDWVFEGCSSLRYADLGSALTTISTGMFYDCYSLEALYFRGDAPEEICELAFEGTMADLKFCQLGSGFNWTYPTWNSFTVIPLAEDTVIPIEIPNIVETTMIDATTEIEVDGKKDAIYSIEGVTVADCNKLMPGYTNTGASAKASMVGHSGLLYLYIEVTDDEIIVPDDPECALWDKDSVEFFLWTHNKVFDETHQFRLDASGYPSYYSLNHQLTENAETSFDGEAAKDFFEAFEVVRTETGYVIEACIDVKKYGISYWEDVGIQMQLNDAYRIDDETTGISRYTYTYCIQDGSHLTAFYDNAMIGGWLYSMTREYVKPDASYRGEVAKINSDAITIDGKMDEAVWANALQIPIDQKIQGHIGDGDTGARAFAYMLWSDGKWYLYVNVNDDHVEKPIPELQATEPWRTDSVEMFFDFGGKHEHFVKQFRLDCSGYPSYYLEGDREHAYGDAAKEYFNDYKVIIDDEGYNIELCLNMESYNLDEEDIIGIQLQLNDMWSEIHPDDNAAMLVMDSALDARSWDIAYYDYVKLGDLLEDQVLNTTEYDAFLIPSADTVQPGDTFNLDFFIPDDKEIVTSGFALSNFVYNKNSFAIDTENINIFAAPIIRDITETGNILMAFDQEKALYGTIVRIPVTVLEGAARGAATISCTAQYQANLANERLMTKYASVFVNSENTTSKPQESCRGEVTKIDSRAITIDGKMDEAVWADALQIPIDRLTSFASGKGTGANAVASMLWADGKWYLYVNVFDETIDEEKSEIQLSEPWRTDSVEMFFDFGGQHEQLVSQFRLDRSGYASYYVEGDVFHAYGDAAADYIEAFSVIQDEDGYNIEMCLNMEPYGLDEKDIIGIQLQLNDVDPAYASEDLCAIYVMDSAMGASSWDVEMYDYIKLGREVNYSEGTTIEGGVLSLVPQEGKTTFKADESFELKFSITANEFVTNYFSLTNFRYNTGAFEICHNNIYIEIEGTNADQKLKLSPDISQNGNIMLTLNNREDLKELVITIPFKVKKDVPNGEYQFSCSALYKDGNITGNLIVDAKSAVVEVKSESTIQIGDLDDDGFVTTNDAILLLQYAYSPDKYQITETTAAYDYSGDGVINTADAIWLLEYALSLNNNLINK